MFYPFNAKMAENRTHKAMEELLQLQENLLRAYLEVAEVYIQRAALRGYNTTEVYCPFEISKTFVKSLVDAGFKIEKSSLPNKYIISW